jgi:HSP20 family protein
MRQYSNFFAQTHTVVPASSMSGRFSGEQCTAWQPLVDIYECAAGLVVVVELPGVDKDQIRVEVVRGHLRIAGERPHKLPEGARNVHHMEIPYGPYSRSVELPDWAAAEKIEAEYRDGYLTVTVPRKEQP